MATVRAPMVPNPVASLKNILFATDFSEASMKAFPYAADLAKKFGASIFACHIITPTSLVTAAPQSAPYFYEAEYEAATKELDNILHSPQLEGIKTKALVSSGILGDALLDEINQNKIDLIVAGTHGRTGFRRLLLGSAVESICRVATCPVLTVGPDHPSTRIKVNNVIVPTDLSADSMRSLPFVARLAGAYGAKVTVLHVLPEETASNPDTLKLSEPVVRSMVHTFEPRLAPLKTEFVIESGETVETILRVAHEKSADMIVLGIRDDFLPGVHVRTSVAYRLMAASECPVVSCR
ncbi:MAG TPA: universal stress protein [Candidatus Binatia bacterium]|nr:universal stress protein [Candidatus Binatia bacterium]